MRYFRYGFPALMLFCSTAFCDYYWTSAGGGYSYRFVVPPKDINMGNKWTYFTYYAVIRKASSSSNWSVYNVTMNAAGLASIGFPFPVSSYAVLQDAMTPANFSADTDGDGYTDVQESILGSDPNLASSVPDASADTDGDGISDGLELQSGSNPFDSSVTPTGYTPLYSGGKVVALTDAEGNIVGEQWGFYKDSSGNVIGVTHNGSYVSLGSVPYTMMYDSSGGELGVVTTISGSQAEFYNGSAPSSGSVIYNKSGSPIGRISNTGSYEAYSSSGSGGSSGGSGGTGGSGWDNTGFTPSDPVDPGTSAEATIKNFDDFGRTAWANYTADALNYISKSQDVQLETSRYIMSDTNKLVINSNRLLEYQQMGFSKLDDLYDGLILIGQNTGDTSDALDQINAKLSTMDFNPEVNVEVNPEITVETDLTPITGSLTVIDSKLQTLIDKPVANMDSVNDNLNDIKNLLVPVNPVTPIESGYEGGHGELDDGSAINTTGGSLGRVGGILNHTYDQTAPKFTFPFSAITMGHMEDIDIDFGSPELKVWIDYLRVFEIGCLVLWGLYAAIWIIRSLEI